MECSFNDLCCKNLLEQILHWYGLLGGWVFLCIFNFFFVLNAKGQVELGHLNGKLLKNWSSVCDILCIKKSLVLLNVWPQTLHLWNEFFKHVSVVENLIEFELK